jgi:hypothetical protein
MLQHAAFCFALAELPDLGTPGWLPRAKQTSTLNSTISRMYYTSVAEGERHFLRLLLLSVPSPTSFENLRTVGESLAPHPRSQSLMHPRCSHALHK